MVSPTLAARAMSFILVYIVLLNDVKSEFSVPRHNATTLESSWKSGRSKRSPSNALPTKLKIRVKLEMGEEIDLTWTKTQQYVANEHLPVITLLIDLHPNVLHNFGEYVMYHDIKKCSAVVYFEKFNALYGVIRTNYYIRALPYAFNSKGEYQGGVIGEPHILKRNHALTHSHLDNIFPLPFDHPEGDINRPSTSDSGGTRKRQSDCHVGPSTKYLRTDEDLSESIRGEGVDADEERISNTRKIVIRRDVNEFYLETLVFVTRDIVEHFKGHFGPDHYIKGIVRYYIIYFNALDMIFKQLQTGRKMHINIAKIVIEDALLLPFDFMSNDYVQLTDIAEKLPQYLHAHQHQYIPDSFDYVFIHTSRTIMNEFMPVSGLTKSGEDLYEARKINQFYDAVPVTVVQYRNNHADYLVAAHEIGRMLGLEIDSQNNEMEPLRHCYSIMQREGPKCDNCLRWSDNSRKQFNVFFRTNRNRCFLLNAPRSLRPPGASRFTTPQRQCQCFGYDSYIMYDSGRSEKTVKMYGCNEPLQCQKGYGSQSQVELTVWPFDGTPCTEKKVCWNQQCVSHR